MQAKAGQIFLTGAAVAAVLLVLAPQANAALENKATYSVVLQAVQQPNTGSTFLPGANGAQSSVSYPPYANPPLPVQISGSANSGPNHNGYGYANGIAWASAEAGVLKAAALTEAQATAQPGTNVGAGATATALAKFTDLATFTSAGHYQNLLIVSGSLLLDGDMSVRNGFARVKVGGTGLNPQQAFAEWIGESDGRQKSAAGAYSPWVPGSAVSIPFTFTVYSGQATELSYWLDVYAAAGASFAPCQASGGLCNIVQTDSNIASVDYSHTLAWGGVSVTDWFGNPVAFTSSSVSGFNYATAYAPTVPVPAAAWLFGSSLLGLLAMRRRAV